MPYHHVKVGDVVELVVVVVVGVRFVATKVIVVVLSVVGWMGPKLAFAFL